MPIYISTVGEEQAAEWLEHSAADAVAIREARTSMAAQEFTRASLLLDPLVRAGNPEALFLAAAFSMPNESADEFEKRRFDLLRKSAEQDFPPALYSLGFYYDMGELIDQDKIAAARLFRRAASRGHAHSRWIHGLNLLYGKDGVEKDELEGIRQITAAADAKFQGALETLAKFYERGELGFPIDLEKAKALRSRANDDDVLGY